MTYLKIKKLLQNKKNLTTKQQRLCDYIIENMNEIAFLSANQLAKKAGVGKATFFRFLKDANFNSYFEFKQDIHDYISNNINSNYWQTHALIKNKHNNDFLYSSVEEATNLLTNMMTTGLNSSFEKAINLIMSSEEIAILGCRTSKQLAIYFENILLPLGKKINQLSVNEQMIFDKISLLNSNTTLFLIAGAPYTSIVIQAVELASKNNISIIFLSNDISSSISSMSDVILLTPKSENRYTIIPFISVIEALTNDLLSRNSDKVSRNLKKIDESLRKYNQVKWL
ncbi:MurR/RpiR family transcriptional regulator [Fusobacterium sp. MFO224]|uniref:MurR/RpiR family transcriptional regulator n=1 Tax=Fusobacterium sp. MFO224 TaxID=3378070 RepID=UPI003852C55A